MIFTLTKLQIQNYKFKISPWLIHYANIVSHLQTLIMISPYCLYYQMQSGYFIQSPPPIGRCQTQPISIPSFAIKYPKVQNYLKKYFNFRTSFIIWFPQTFDSVDIFLRARTQCELLGNCEMVFLFFI